jgi:hypothetical protein
MNERVKELAEKAGFVMWGKETWNPGDVIDWSCRYDDELTKLVELIVKECAKRSEELGQPELGKGLKKHFGVE